MMWSWYTQYFFIKENWFFCCYLRSYHLWTASWIGVRLNTHLVSSELGFILAQACAYLLHAETFSCISTYKHMCIHTYVLYTRYIILWYIYKYLIHIYIYKYLIYIYLIYIHTHLMCLKYLPNRSPNIRNVLYCFESLDKRVPKAPIHYGLLSMLLISIQNLTARLYW